MYVKSNEFRNTLFHCNAYLLNVVYSSPQRVHCPRSHCWNAVKERAERKLGAILSSCLGWRNNPKDVILTQFSSKTSA